MDWQKPNQASDATTAPCWYCLRSRPRQEHLAEQLLRHRAGIDAFAPRLRVRRKTRRGPVWFVEGLFPGYLFARFSRARQDRLVLSTMGVTGILHFGHFVPTLPDAVMREMRNAIGDAGVVLMDDIPHPGDEVRMNAGPFEGLCGIVQHYLPARQRVRVLLDFMGRELPVETGEAYVVSARRRLAGPLLNAAT